MPYSKYRTVEYSSLSISSLQDWEAPKGVLDLNQPPAGQGGEGGIHEEKLNATQKTTALYKTLFLKKSRKTARNWLFLTKNAFSTIFRQFFLIFSRTMLCRGLRFFALHPVTQNA